MTIYSLRRNQFEQELKTVKSKFNFISLLRLASIVLVLIFAYYYIQKKELLLLFLSASFFIAFVFLMKRHNKLRFQIKIKESLIKINSDEIDFLENNKLPFENGAEFQDFQHPYAYDLDLFGNHSLFQNLNRTATYIGKQTLAKQSLDLLSNDEIISNQEAVKELAGKLDWRQEFLALASVNPDNEESYKTLLRWTTYNSNPISKVQELFLLLLPMLFSGIAIGYWFTDSMVLLKLLSFVFVINLSFLSLFIKRIQKENANSSVIDKIISQYGLLLQKIENEPFQSNRLLELQSKLLLDKEKASMHLNKLASLFSKMDSISNIVTVVLFNGTFLYNVFVFRSLIAWKKQHAKILESWLDVIGEFEMLNSLANLSYNNPDFIFPELNLNQEITFSNLSHPLLSKRNRVGNTIDFQPQSFIILTGSNMSGKSTFLRSLGINMVLTGMGSAICATKANVCPMPVLVSMRLSDSLSDSESYFFAEIKRLKQIMDALEERPAFVLLDEILRGTNSDDKRNGTIEVIKKVIAKKAIGAIATHDIEVCLTTNEYPESLVNKCFEVEITNNDLHFDFVLREGVCKNKSATFLMKKTGVI
jgi:hypothetical protein